MWTTKTKIHKRRKCRRKLIILGRVINDVGGKFTVVSNDEKFDCFSPKKIKLKTKVVVGDFVEIQKIENDYVITQICERDNVLIRPRVANISQILIVIAVVPEPDFLLVDKLLIMAKNMGVKTCLCINKNDISNNHFYLDVKSQYSQMADSIVEVSAKQNNLSNLAQILKNNTTVLCGQSAVGKTSIINGLIPNLLLETGELSQKIDRGKNTTRTTELYSIDRDTFIIDSPGFSLLDISDIEYDKLKDFYPEFSNLNCYYSNCTHTTEPESQCQVKQLITNNQINKNRYFRYVTLFNELKNKRRY